MTELEKDIELLELYRNSGDIKYRNELSLKYSYIAAITAKKFSQRGVAYDDLYQVAFLAIIKAIERFDESRNLQMSTFLTHSAIGEIKNYFRDKVSLVKISRESKTLFQNINKVKDELEKTLCRNPTPSDIATALGIDVEKVLEGMEYNMGVLSLDSQIADSGTTLYEIIEDDKNQYIDVENKDFFISCLNSLNDIEQKIVKYRYVDELSQTETAKLLSVSQMMVSRLERKILIKLKELI